MNTRACKTKGRTFQKEIARDIAELVGCEVGENELVESCPMSQSGVDIRLRGHAQKDFPFSVECKRQEHLAIPQWIKQADANLIKNTNWLLVCKQNHKKAIVVLDYAVFMRMVKTSNKLKKLRTELKEVKNEKQRCNGETTPTRTRH